MHYCRQQSNEAQIVGNLIKNSQCFQVNLYDLDIQSIITINILSYLIIIIFSKLIIITTIILS